MEFIIILFLLILNGIFAMYEIALVSSSKARLETLVSKGNKSAKGVLKQLEEPEKFLSTIQIGITLIGIISGAYGGVAIADEKGVIFACPDGKNSWYWDSPRNSAYRYETFISSELVKYTDEHYATIPKKSARAISGLSMGGHGALWNAIRHSDIFGAAGSMSGGVDIRPFPDNWEMKKQLGELAANEAVWDSHTVINQVDKLKNGDLALIVDCGESDFFLDVNRNLHKRLLECKIDHDFITRPGGHTGTYWNNSIDYHILFFCKFFSR